MIAITTAILVYIGFGYLLSNGMFPSLHLPFLVIQPDRLRLLTMAGFALGAALVGLAVQWERFNMAPERLQARVRGEDAVRTLLTRVYVFQAVLLETVGIIGLVLLFA